MLPEIKLNKKGKTDEIGLLFVALFLLLVGVTAIATANGNNITLLVGAVFLLVGIIALLETLTQFGII